jgi:hypothetical protein
MSQQIACLLRECSHFLHVCEKFRRYPPAAVPSGAILHLRNAQPHTAGLSLSCRAVLDSAAEKVAVVGPCLEEEGAKPHQGYWQEGAA